MAEKTTPEIVPTKQNKTKGVLTKVAKNQLFSDMLSSAINSVLSCANNDEINKTKIKTRTAEDISLLSIIMTCFYFLIIL